MHTSSSNLHCASNLTPPAPQSGNPAPHRGTQVCCHPLRVPPGVPAWTMPQHRLWCRRKRERQRRRHACCTRLRNKWFGEETKKSSFPWTTFLRLRQPKTTSFAQQLRVPALLPATGRLQRNPISLNCASHWSATPVESTHQCGVHRQLSTSEERQTISDDFEPPPVGDIRVAQVKFPYEDVR